MALREENLDGASGGGKTITDAQAEDAFRTILKWIGEDATRDGLIETPDRLVRAYREYFAGYDEDPHEVLRKTFSEVDGYDEMIVLRGVTFESHCEHHIAPIIGRVWIGYIPDKRVVGISKLARVVEIFSKRLQIQERLTAQIANAIEEMLETLRGRRRGQGRASLHDRPGRPQAWRRPCHQPDAGRVSRSAPDPAGVLVARQLGQPRITRRMIGAFRIEAYVIASADGMLADASGVQPASLQFEADHRHFKQGLDQADVVVNGRHSQEGHANAMSRRRLVLTRHVAGLAPDPDNPKARLWNPAGASLRGRVRRARLEFRDGRRHWRAAGLHPVPQARLRLFLPEPRDQGAAARRPARL